MAKESVAQNNIWKWLVFAAVTIGAVWLAYPPREKIRLGLDLKGGNSFTLGVDYARLHDKIIESKPELANDPEALEAEVKRTLESKDFDDRMIEIIRRRVDAMGTNEPLIQSVKGKHQIVVQLPGADQKTGDEARERLQKMAYLEFRFVPENEEELLRKIPANACPPGFVASGDGYIKAKDWKTVSTNANYLTRLSSFGTTDRSVRFILEPVKDPKTGRFSYYKGRYVEKKVQLTGDSLALATPDSNHGSFKGGYCVGFGPEGYCSDGSSSPRPSSRARSAATGKSPAASRARRPRRSPPTSTRARFRRRSRSTPSPRSTPPSAATPSAPAFRPRSSASSWSRSS